MLAKALRTIYPSVIQVADKRSGSKVRASQAAGKLIFLKGTGFSPYIKETRTMGFSPGGQLWAERSEKHFLRA
jgi:hypothetical protein